MTDLLIADAAPGVPPDQTLPKLPDDKVVTDDEGNVLPTRWHAVAAPEGVMTGDRRMFAPGALGSRPLPLPLKYVDATSQGHDGAQTAGTIDQIERRPGYVYAAGTYDLGSPVGREAARQSLKQMNRFVSVDLTDVDAEHVMGPDVDPDDLLALLTDDGGYDLIHQGNIAAITQCSIPAFSQAVIAPHDQELDLSGLPAVGQPLGLIAAVPLIHGDEDLPPAAAFAQTKLTRPTHLSVTDAPFGGVLGVFGHLAIWGQPHIGMAGKVYAPRSRTGYAHFRTGITRAREEDGTIVEIPTGRLTAGTGHAPQLANHRVTADHYDHTGAAVADVAAGEDEFGIWLAGVVRPEATAAQIRVLRASDVSGDWREVGGHLELVAALMVNVAGFNIPRYVTAAALTAEDVPFETGQPRWGEVDGRQVSLVAAGVLRRDPMREALLKLAQRNAELAVTVEAHGRMLDVLRPQIGEALAARIGATL